jgi:hypothetical protein
MIVMDVMDVIVANANAIAAASVAVVVGKEEDSWDSGARGPVLGNGTWKGETKTREIGNGNRIGRA